MSAEATQWAWSQTIRSTYKLVLLSLSNRADKNDTCWPSIERIRKDTGLDVKTVRAALRELAKSGLVEAEESNGRGYHYHLCLGVKIEASTPTEIGTGTEIGTPTKNGCEPLPKTAGGGTKNGCEPLPKTVPESKRESNKNLKENLKEYTRAKKMSQMDELKALCEEYTASTPLRDALYAFLEMRAGKKKLPTQHALKLIFKKLETWCGDDEQDKTLVLEKSTVNSWTDVYPQKPDEIARGQPPPCRIGVSGHGNRTNSQDREHKQSEMPEWAKEVVENADETRANNGLGQ